MPGFHAGEIDVQTRLGVRADNERVGDIIAALQLAGPALARRRVPARGRGLRQLPEVHPSENDPAGQVFKNMRIEWLRTTPARQLLDIMNGGYARALGVRCTHRATCDVRELLASGQRGA
jgi:hypothetical protein